jgi:hypothetical protein
MSALNGGPAPVDRATDCAPALVDHAPDDGPDVLVGSQAPDNVGAGE